MYAIRYTYVNRIFKKTIDISSSKVRIFIYH